MQIPITVSENLVDSNSSGIVLVELQGLLNTESETFQSLHLGSISTTATGAPSMLIGCHKLIGEWVKLKRPVAVMKRMPAGDNGFSYEVQFVVNRKAVFSRRPQHHVNLAR